MFFLTFYLSMNPQKVPITDSPPKIKNKNK